MEHSYRRVEDGEGTDGARTFTETETEAKDRFGT